MKSVTLHKMSIGDLLCLQYPGEAGLQQVTGPLYQEDDHVVLCHGVLVRFVLL